MRILVTWHHAEYFPLVNQQGLPRGELSSLVRPVYPHSRDAMNWWKKSKAATIPLRAPYSLAGLSLSTQHIEYSKPFPHPPQELLQSIGLPSFLSCFPMLLANLLLTQLIFNPHKNKTKPQPTPFSSGRDALKCPSYSSHVSKDSVYLLSPAPPLSPSQAL